MSVSRLFILSLCPVFRTFSSSSSRVPHTHFARSLSRTLSSSTTLPPQHGDQLSAMPMTPHARVALTAFVELFASSDIPITPADMQGDESDCDNVVLTTTIDPGVFSVVRDGATSVSVGCDMVTTLDGMRTIATSFFDAIALKTSSGVALLQKRRGRNRVRTGLAVSEVDSAAQSQLPICCSKYQGSFALASGRIYVLSR